MSIFSYLRGSGSGQSSVRNARGSRARDVVARACSLEELEMRRLMDATNPQLISVSTAGAVGNNNSPPISASAPGFGPKISDNGRFVVFDSSATNLDPAHPASADEVYIRDTVKGTTSMVSLDPFGQPIPNSYVADVSGDGRYVLFFGTSNSTTFLYRRDTASNSTVVVSVGYNEFTRSPRTIDVSADPVTHLPTLPAAISADGSRVAFATPNRFVVQSHDDQNAADDIYVRDLTTGTNFWVSTTLADTASLLHGEKVYSFAMNADGTAVVYDSDENLASTTGLRRRVNLHSLITNSTVDVSSGVTTNGGNSSTTFSSTNATISKDGSTVAFLSDDPVLSGASTGSTTVIPPQVILAKINSFTNSVTDVVVASRQRGGGPSDGTASFTPRLSSDGNFVAFWDDGSDLVSNPTSNTNLYRYDYRKNSVALVSTNSTGVGASAFDPRIAMSNDGRFIAWASDATGADLSVTNYGGAGQQNVFVRDMNSFTIRLMNVSSTDPAAAANAGAAHPALSADGKVLTFTSIATNLNPVDNTATSDVYAAQVPVFPPASMTPLLNAPDVLIGGGTAYYFTVTYNSSLPVKISTLGDGDVTVVYPPLGFTAVAKLLPGSITLTSDGTPVSATYFITPPGGSWDVADNTLDPNIFLNPQRYVVRLNPSEVTDIQGNPFPDQDLGSFRVDISYPNEAGSGATASVNENDPAHQVTVFVTRTDALPGNATVSFRTVQGSAAPGQDYTDTTGTLTFAPGETKPITIPILDDSILEGDETFRIVLTDATSGALFTWGQTTVTILDDEAPPSPPGGGDVVVPPNSPIGVTVGQGGSTISLEDGVPVVRAPETIDTDAYAPGQLPITISRADTGTLGTPVTFDYTVYSTPSDSAVGNQNFVAASGTLSFAANESTKDLLVQLLHDHIVTGDRTFTVVLTNATNGLVIGGASVRVVVQDVDSALQFSSASLSTNDDAGIIDIPITRIGNTTPTSKVNLSFSGSAINGLDFALVNDGAIDSLGDITFAPGETSKVVHVQLLSRPFNPGTSKTLNLNLINPRALATSDPFSYETVLGTPSTESVTINNVDATAPQVAGVDFQLKKGKIASVLVTFNEDVTAAGANKLSNYALFTRTRNGKLGHLIRLSSASYDPASDTVTLTPRKPLAANQMYQINVNGKGSIADTAGNHLDGDANGTPTGSFNGLFGTGRSLAYADQDNDLVSFSLKGPGTLKITSLNSAVTVDVLNPDADNTTLLGNVNKRKGGNGKTTLSLLRLRGATFDADESKFEGDIRADV